MAIPTTTICQKRPARRSWLSEMGNRLRRAGAGVDVVTAQDPSGSSDLRPCASGARFICCTERLFVQHTFHDPAAVEVLAPQRTLQRVAVAAVSFFNDSAVSEIYPLSLHDAFDARPGRRGGRRS